MLKGKTKTGFEFEISDEALNNYELIETLAEVDANPLLIPKLLNQLLGKEQQQKLKDHVRDKKGFVSVQAMSDEILDIFQSGADVKNG